MDQKRSRNSEEHRHNEQSRPSPQEHGANHPYGDNSPQNQDTMSLKSWQSLPKPINNPPGPEEGRDEQEKGNDQGHNTYP